MRLPFRQWGAAAAIALLLAAAARADNDTKMKVKEGDRAPDIELPAAQAQSALPDHKDGSPLRLKDFEGKKNVVLYFFPKAATTG